MNDPRLIVILGPTAGGKTALSLGLARSLPAWPDIEPASAPPLAAADDAHAHPIAPNRNVPVATPPPRRPHTVPGSSGEDEPPAGEIVSADSMQIYRRMDIGTAKPTAAERAVAPHHLLDMVDPAEAFSASDWLAQAERTIAEVRVRRRWPIVVGGTNLYIRLLMEGMFVGPPADEDLRAELAERSTLELHQRLEAVDPEAATRIHPNDRKRLTRAIEVYAQTGRPISDWQREWDAARNSDGGTAASPGRSDAIIIGLDWPPEAINRRINARVREMVEAGLVAEVEQLHREGRLGPQAREALGYKQIIDFLEGRSTKDDAIERIRIETRRFARKQRTWLKQFRRYQPALWLDAVSSTTAELTDAAVRFCLRQVSEAGPNGGADGDASREHSRG